MPAAQTSGAQAVRLRGQDSVVRPPSSAGNSLVSSGVASSSGERMRALNEDGSVGDFTAVCGRADLRSASGTRFTRQPSPALEDPDKACRGKIPLRWVVRSPDPRAGRHRERPRSLSRFPARADLRLAEPPRVAAPAFRRRQPVERSASRALRGDRKTPARRRPDSRRVGALAGGEPGQDLLAVIDDGRDVLAVGDQAFGGSQQPPVMLGMGHRHHPVLAAVQQQGRQGSTVGGPDPKDGSAPGYRRAGRWPLGRRPGPGRPGGCRGRRGARPDRPDSCAAPTPAAAAAGARPGGGSPPRRCRPATGPRGGGHGQVGASARQHRRPRPRSRARTCRSEAPGGGPGPAPARPSPAHKAPRPRRRTAPCGRARCGSCPRAGGPPPTVRRRRAAGRSRHSPADRRRRCGRRTAAAARPPSPAPGGCWRSRGGRGSAGRRRVRSSGRRGCGPRRGAAARPRQAQDRHGKWRSGSCPRRHRHARTFHEHGGDA